MVVLTAKDSNSRIVVMATGCAPRKNADHYSIFRQQQRRSNEMAELMNKEDTTVNVDGHRESRKAILETFS